MLELTMFFYFLITVTGAVMYWLYFWSSDERESNVISKLLILSIVIMVFLMTSGFTIQVDHNMDYRTQRINTVEAVQLNVNLLDKKILPYIKTIKVTDKECEYNHLYGFEALATASHDGTITIYPQNQLIITDVFYHEVGHLIDFQHNITNGAIYKWIYKSKYIPKFSTTNIQEDFAEAVKYYFMDSTKLDYYRKVIIERVINK
jgi:hypothetical protein